MGKTLYLECASGISGDMTVAALLDLGADVPVLMAALESLRVPGYRTQIRRVNKAGLDACDFAVLLDAEHENHDHDMHYLHGHALDGHQEQHTHGEHFHEHASREDHVHPEHHHEHRTLRDILPIIERGALTPRAKALAERIFTILAQAESQAHGVPIEEVHFHEVGAVDSIVDIVAAAVCFDYLDITEVIVPRLNEGCGSIRCQHGWIPVPVPATLHIAETYHLPLHFTGVEGELVTPTGAAIAAAVRTSGTLPEQFRVVKTGFGAGKREYERPSLLRAMLIEADAPASDEIIKLETNIDDSSPEALGYVMEQLLAAGARDVYYQPVYMKKNRPAYQLNVLCREEDRTALEMILFRGTSTIGIRRVRMQRSVLPRAVRRVSTPLGAAEVKVCTLPDGTVRIYPEYESVAALCRQSGAPFPEVWELVRRCGEAPEETTAGTVR